MTDEERARALLLDLRSSPYTLEELIAAALRDARRAALEEAAQIAEERAVLLRNAIAREDKHGSRDKDGFMRLYVLETRETEVSALAAALRQRAGEG